MNDLAELPLSMTRVERNSALLYYELCCARDLRLLAEHYGVQTQEGLMKMIERQDWVKNIKARLYNMRIEELAPDGLCADMARAEGIWV